MAILWREYCNSAKSISQNMGVRGANFCGWPFRLDEMAIHFWKILRLAISWANAAPALGARRRLALIFGTTFGTLKEAH